MNCQFHTPRKSLTPAVACIWSMEISGTSGTSCTQRLMPSGFVELSFFWGDRGLLTPAKIDDSVNADGFVAGQKTRFLDLHLAGGSGGVLSIMIKPTAALAVLGTGADELKNQHVSPKELFGFKGALLSEQVACGKSIADRVCIVEAFIEQRIHDDRHAPDPLVARAVAALSSSGGQGKIGDLCKMLYLSRRQFERRFASTVGLSPKEFARALRYQSILAAVQKGGVSSYTDLAYSCGFSDQAHFNRDFKSITGYPPKVFFKMEPACSDYYTFMS